MTTWENLQSEHHLMSEAASPSRRRVLPSGRVLLIAAGVLIVLLVALRVVIPLWQLNATIHDLEARGCEFRSDGDPKWLPDWADRISGLRLFWSSSVSLGHAPHNFNDQDLFALLRLK